MDFFLTILGGVFGIVGAFAGAWVANRYEKHQRTAQDRKDTTIALYTEYQSLEMLKARIEARNILTKNINAKNPLSLSELRESLEVEQWLSISIIMTFFEKLGILLENNYLDPTLSKTLLHYDFKYWYEKYLLNLIIRGNQSQAQWWRAIQLVAEKWL